MAGAMCGFTPVWASEIEPYPIAVTKTRFPNMKHLGDISKINGAAIDPVDIITFGSPCQDLSVAGKRAGLKHEDNGDDETTRSGLFMEAVRIIKEMRNATNGKYPTFALWENVPGAFSSNKGEDFRLVLEELIKIAEPNAVMLEVPKSGWAYADSFSGDGWSLAYRVLNAQYWGVPQHRRRIYLVADFRGQCARKILFERKGLRGGFTESGAPWQGITPDAKRGVGADDRIGADQYNAVILGDTISTLGVNCGMSHGRQCVLEPQTAYTLKIRSGCEGGGKGALVQEDKSATIACNNDQYLFQPIIDAHILDDQGGSQIAVRNDGRSPTLRAETHENLPCVLALDRASFNQGKNAQYDFEISDKGVNSPLVAKGPSAVCYNFDPTASRDAGDYISENVSNPLINGTCPGHKRAVCYYDPNNKTRYIVRRLTPTECARLQGFSDRWGDIEPKTEFTDEEYGFWLDVRNTHAAINGKKIKDYTKKQMLTWYNKLHTDSAEYKMWGNGIALPCALFVMRGIAKARNEAMEKDGENKQGGRNE